MDRFSNSSIYDDTLHVAYRGFGPDFVASALVCMFGRGMELQRACNMAADWVRSQNYYLSIDEFSLSDDKFPALNAKGWEVEEGSVRKDVVRKDATEWSNIVVVVQQDVVREDVVRQDATAQSKPPVREDVVRKDVAPCAWAALLSGTWSSRGLAPTGEDAFGSMECLGSNLVLVIELIQIVVVVTEEAKAKEIFKKRKQNEMAKAANRNDTVRDRRETEERRVEQWKRSQAADVKTAKAEQQSEMAKTKMIQANAILDAAKVAFASSSGSQSAKKNAKGAAERILRELKSESEESSSSSSSKSPVQKKKKKQGRPAVDKKADKNKKGAKNVSKSRGRHR
ncbi:unnamed protein product [Symbiodinium sp. CCMP2592]|nr:unnamed protein product [Symbiodinium sp. CCMP2592]